MRHGILTQNGGPSQSRRERQARGAGGYLPVHLPSTSAGSVAIAAAAPTLACPPSPSLASSAGCMPTEGGMKRSIKQV
jgi:hypothetical protein